MDGALYAVKRPVVVVVDVELDVTRETVGDHLADVSHGIVTCRVGVWRLFRDSSSESFSTLLLTCFTT